MAKKSKVISIYDLAEYFIHYGIKHHKHVTPFKLQKLCYYAEAFYLTCYNRPLTGKRFQAWTTGPVSKSLWKAYKSWGFEPIIIGDRLAKPKFDKHTIKYLKWIVKNLFDYSEYHLECMTRREVPWLNARGCTEDGMKCRKKISRKEMREYYKQFLKKE